MLALVTCRAAQGLDTDLALLRRELPEATVAVWDDPTIDWSEFSVAIVRSTWDYHTRHDDFLRWARHELAARRHPRRTSARRPDRRSPPRHRVHKDRPAPDR